MDLPKIKDLIKEADPDYLEELIIELRRLGLIRIATFLLRDMNGDLHSPRSFKTEIVVNSFDPQTFENTLFSLVLITERRDPDILLVSNNQKDLLRAREYLLKCYLEGSFADLQNWIPEKP